MKKTTTTKTGKIEMTDTEVIESVCSVTVHALDRINERFPDKIGDLLDAVIRHVEMLSIHQFVGISRCTLNGICTVIEPIDDVPTLVTVYSAEKDYSYTPQGKYRGKRNRKKNSKERRNKREFNDI